MNRRDLLKGILAVPALPLALSELTLPTGAAPEEGAWLVTGTGKQTAIYAGNTTMFAIDRALTGQEINNVMAYYRQLYGVGLFALNQTS